MVKFIVDSTFGLTREYVEQYDIKVVSLTLTLGSKEYDEGFREMWPDFYKKLAKSKTGGKTSQPSPEKFKKAIDEIYAQDEGSEILIFTIADRLSGTIGSANIAVSDYEGKKIAAVNSGEAGPSALMFMREIVKAQQAGATFEQLLELAADLQQRIAMQFIPASLTELARGGRVNKLLSRVGNILKIKPVFEFAKNDLSIYAKTLGFNRAAEAAIARLPQKFDSIMLYYIGDDKFIEPLKARLESKLGIKDVEVEPMCLVGGVHIGIGTVGIVTLASKEQ
ncbi:MAG: DegV family protein [Clostridiales bacterium]|nr:DegV family protein [Clostridiales bacterium]